MKKIRSLSNRDCFHQKLKNGEQKMYWITAYFYKIFYYIPLKTMLPCSIKHLLIRKKNQDIKNDKSCILSSINICLFSSSPLSFFEEIIYSKGKNTIQNLIFLFFYENTVYKSRKKFLTVSIFSYVIFS